MNFTIFGNQIANMIKIYCENLEKLIWWNGESQLPYVIQRISDQIDNEVPFVFVGRLLWECDYDFTIDLQKLLSVLKFRKIKTVLVVNFHLKNTEFVQHIENNFPVRIVYVDYFIWRIYDLIVTKNRNPRNDKWNEESDKCLFLTGKPLGLHRIGLLYRLYKEGLLDKIIWSLIVPQDVRSEAVKYLPDLDIDQANEWINRHLAMPDSDIVADREFLDTGTSHGFPYDKKLYSQNKFRLISETLFTDKEIPWLTEKTWITIANCCPFVMAGNPGSLAYLESLGFRTFRNYLPIPEYDSIIDPSKRIDSIVENVKFLLDSQLPHDKVQDDVQHNYRRFIDLNLAYEKKWAEEIGIGLPFDQLISSEHDLSNPIL